MKINEFNPSKELMRRVYWVNRNFNRIMKLHEATHVKLMVSSNNDYYSFESQNLRDLMSRINQKIKVMARYSSILTTKALKATI